DRGIRAGCLIRAASGLRLGEGPGFRERACLREGGGLREEGGFRERACLGERGGLRARTDQRKQDGGPKEAGVSSRPRKPVSESCATSSALASGIPAGGGVVHAVG